MEAVKTDPTLSMNIKLYIQEDMDINAFAFGRETLVLTRGSLELLNDDGIKGLIAHELGHFSHYDTIVQLFAAVGNFYISLLTRIIYQITKGKDSFILLMASANSGAIDTIFILSFIFSGSIGIVFVTTNSLSGDLFILSIADPAKIA